MKMLKKKTVGQRRVYDIEVEDVHNFYANGINVHNCATDGGVSVIKDDGTVFSFGGGLLTTALAISSDNRFLTVGRKASQRLVSTFLGGNTLALESGDGGNSFTAIYAMSADFTTATQIAYDRGAATEDTPDFIHGGFKRLSLVDIDPTLFDKSMVCDLRTTYNTGWMNGDIKGAFLSDTDDTDLDSTDEKVVNGTFDTNTSGWTPNNLGLLSVDTQRLKVETGNSGSWNYGYQQVSVTPNQAYRFRASSTEGTATTHRILLGTSVTNANIVNSGGSLGSAGDKSVDVVFTATTTSVYVALQNTDGVLGSYTFFDDISIVPADADRSVNNKGLTVNGTVTRSPVATGADLVAYSGFSASNYFSQPYNSDLDFGTGDFCVMGWYYGGAINGYFLDSRDTGQGGFALGINGASRLQLIPKSSAGSFTDVSGADTVVSPTALTFFTALRRGGICELYANGKLLRSQASAVDVNGTAPLIVGAFASGGIASPWTGSLALLRISATAPTAKQIKKIYEDEKVLFQENAQATLYGSSDAVTALAHDSTTNLLHVGSSYGRSVFQGLRRVSNTTTAVGTAISASNGMIAEE